MTKPQKLSTSNFDSEVNDATIPVLVDFYADWCGPCRAQAPILDALAAEYAGRVKVAKVDIDAEPELAQRYSVTSIPTLILFSDGEPVETLVGARPKSNLEHVLQGAIR